MVKNNFHFFNRNYHKWTGIGQEFIFFKNVNVRE